MARKGDPKPSFLGGVGCGAAFFWLSIIIPQGQALR